jgi:hypothetical protein
MADPWVPSYFGSWDELVAYVISAALHPAPHGPVPLPFLPHDAMLAHRHPLPKYPGQFMLPVPCPWYPAVHALVSAVTAQQVAQAVQEPLRSQIERSASECIAQALDGYCGTPPRSIPWPFPGPPPWIFAIASELNAIANTVEAPGMREGLLNVAGQVVERSFGQATPMQ